MPTPDAGGTNRLRDERDAKRVLKGAGLEANAIKKQKDSEKIASKKKKIKQRKTIDTVSKSLLPKAKEKSEKFETLVDGKEVVNEFGYKMKIFVPKGFDGGIDLYFPGGGSGIETPMKRDDLRGKWFAAGKKGKRRALAIIEGKVKPKWRVHKYAYLANRRALPSILKTIQGTYDGPSIKNVHAIGHSMGGQAIHYLSSRPEVTGVTCLDSTYWSHKPIVDLARRGGRVNVVFRPGTRTAAVAERIIKKLGLKKVGSGKWESADKRVKVYATRVGHSALVNPYVGMFLGASSVPVKTSSLFIEKYAATGGYGGMSIERMKKVEKENPAGSLHKKYLERVKGIDAKTAANDMKALKGSSIEDVRYNTKLLVGSEKESAESIKTETQRRIKAYTSGYDGEWYTLDYAKMGSDSKGRSHEEYIGIGEVFIDPSIESVMVDRGGEMILAKRGVIQSGKRKGRVGFVDEKGDYAFTHTGDRVRILTKNELAEKQLLEKYKEETAQRDKHKKSFEAEEDFSGEGEKKGRSGERVSTGPRLRHFPKTKRGEKLWKSIPEAKFVDDGLEIKPREPFVSGKDSFGRTIVLRKSAMRAFYRARAVAESGKYQAPPGPVVRLKITSSYRSAAEQKALNPSGKGGKYLAAPGKSWHQSGGAIDVIACVQNPSTGKWEGNGRHKNQIYLKKIMPLSSFVNLSHEMWHWEYGSTRWKRKTGRKGTRKYTKVMSVNKKRISRFNRLT